MEHNSSLLPMVSGVYVFLSSTDEILYIGKAKNLRKRVAQYFQKRSHDEKIERMLREHKSIRFIATKNEIAALLLEAHLIRTYQPRFNTLLRDGNPFLYLVFTQPNGSELPRMEIVRQKPTEGKIFGPFLHKKEVRKIYEFLERTFQLKLCNKKIEHGCLDYHVGYCAGACRTDFDRTHYINRLELAHDVLIGDHNLFLSHIHEQIERFNKNLEFEKACELHQTAEHLAHLFDVLKTKFNEKSFQKEVVDLLTRNDHSEDDRQQGLAALQELFDLPQKPRTIDCFDISHFQGQHMVGSCVRFTDGQPDPENFRRFIIRSLIHQNDYAALQEIVLRRYRNRKNLPDLILIDGGKGQLHAVAGLVEDSICLSLAKREEILFSDRFPEGIKLNLKEPIGRLLISLRNYAHHFAISFFKAKSLKTFQNKK